MQTNFIGQVLLVGMGGFLGSGLRFAMSVGVQKLLPLGLFPYGTMTVNVLGCLAIGYLGGLLEIRQALDTGMVLFLMVGILGGFTTYSTYAFETLTLAQNGMFLKAGLNVILQVILGLFAAWFGFELVR